MKITIKYKLFFAMLLAAGAVVICMFLIMKWSFHSGFLNYINTLEEQALVRLKTDLEKAYAEEGSWDFLRQNPMAWGRFLDNSQPEELQRTPHPAQRGSGFPPPRNNPSPIEKVRPFPGPPGGPPNGPGTIFPPAPFNRPHSGPFGARVTLLDVQKNPVCGIPAGPLEGKNLNTLLHGEKIIGYLNLVPPQAPPSAQQLRFWKEQKLAMALIALAMFLIAACLSLPIANQLVRPIRTLVRATRELTSGNYSIRAAVSSNDELGQLSRDFNTLALTLEENEKARQQWVADISHELRTPLAVLRGEIEAIQDGIRSAGAEGMETLHAEVLRLTRLVDDLYELSMSDIGALSYKKTEVNPVHLLELTLEGFSSRLENKNIAILTRVPTQDIKGLWADPQRLGQLFANIIENSLNYTNADGRLEIHLNESDGELCIDFLDSAPGVPEADLPRVFERLYRVESSRSRAHGGAGLGLSLCKNIVEAHEGCVAAKLSPHGGLWVAIKLPLNTGAP
ncbi:MAG: HAMP domain-containing protein [Deltaproteobacteria bacterium]|nr:HAMP domain-containing protein [Deltaproteobacteria bacterium]